MKLGLAEKIILPFVLIFSLLGVYFSRTDIHFYEAVYTVEDGLIEWLTVVGLALGALVSFARISLLAPFRSRSFLRFQGLIGFIFLFGIGEELSWGQRFFEFEPPIFFQQYNTQMEFNLHNLRFSGIRINKLIFGLVLGIAVGFYFLVFPTLYQKVSRVRRFADRVGVPMPKILHVVSYLILAFTASLIVSEKRGEVLEFGGIWIVVMMIIQPLNRDTFSRTLQRR